MMKSFISHKVKHHASIDSGLMDFSTQLRCGFRGLNAASHLASIDMPVPDLPNQACLSSQGDIVLRLSQKEFWMLSNPEQKGESVEIINRQSVPEKDCYSLYCQHSHAWFILASEHLSEIMAKICGVNLQKSVFPTGSIAQTSLARVNAIIVSHEYQNKPVFSILSDGSSAEYLWGALLDALSEFNIKESN